MRINASAPHVLFQKISILPQQRVSGLKPHPFGNFSLGSYSPLKIWPIRPPASQNFQWLSAVGVWIFSGTTHRTWQGICQEMKCINYNCFLLCHSIISLIQCNTT